MTHRYAKTYECRRLYSRLRQRNAQCLQRLGITCQGIWTASSEFGTYRLCEQRRFRRACASAQSRQNLHYSLVQAVSQEEPSDRKPDPWHLWMAGHAQLKFVMTECSKTHIRLTGLIFTCIINFHFHNNIVFMSASVLDNTPAILEICPMIPIVI